MADHDLVAELLGYRNELARLEHGGDEPRAAAVRGEIERVEAAVREQAERLEHDAAEYDEAGQGVRAAMLRNEARELRTALGDGQGDGDGRPAKRGPGRPRKETAADTTPKEKA